MRPARILSLALLVVLGCGGSVTKKADTSLATALAATNAARDSFVSWDKDHQMAIVDAATSQADGEAKLTAYRAQRVHVVRAFTVAYSTISAAAALVPLVERGERKSTDLGGALVEVLNAVEAMKRAIAEIKGGS